MEQRRMSEWSDEVDRSTRFTASREIGTARRYLVWMTRLGTTYAPRSIEASSADEATEIARAELAALEDFVNRAL